MVEAQSQLNFSELSLPDKRYYTKGLNRFSNSHLVGASFSIILSITSKFWIVTHLALMRKLKQNHQKILWRRANARNVIRKYCSITSIWMLHPQWITFMDMVFSCGGVSDGNSLLISLFFFFSFNKYIQWKTWRSVQCSLQDYQVIYRWKIRQELQQEISHAQNYNPVRGVAS